MKHLFNLNKIPAELCDLVREDAMHHIERLERRLKRFSDDSSRLYLMVQPGGRYAKRWQARIVLKLPGALVATQSESLDGPADALRKAFGELAQQSQRQQERSRQTRRLRRKTRLQEAIRNVQGEVDKAVQLGQHEVFDLLLRSRADILRQTAHQMLEVAEMEGRLTPGVLTVGDVINDTLLRAWREYADCPDDLPLDLWLARILRERVAETTVSREDDRANQEEQREPVPDLDDADLDSDEWWWLRVDRPGRILWEDLIPDEDIPDMLTSLSFDEFRTRLLSALSRIPQPSRDAITLRALDGYEIEEIERIMNISYEEVQQALHEARDQLQEILSEGEHTMGQALHLANIEAAKEAISVAENELQAVVGDITVVPRAAKAEVSKIVQAASLKLRAAKAKLIDLEESVALAKLEAARVAIDEAEKYLDRVINDIVVVAGADTTCVTKVVQNAFTKLGIAKTTLADLESVATDKD